MTRLQRAVSLASKVAMGTGWPSPVRESQMTTKDNLYGDMIRVAPDSNDGY